MDTRFFCIKNHFIFIIKMVDYNFNFNYYYFFLIIYFY